jgi:exopolysaccharide biosynthesis polyprenyl glycosylphosphotransferase
LDLYAETVAQRTEALDRTRTARGGLHRGRTLMLAVSDVVAIVVAYAITFVAASAIAPPAIIAPKWFMIVLWTLAIPVWVAMFAAYKLYENDSRRINVTSFDEVGAIFHALLAGSLGFLLLGQVLRRLADWWIYSALEAAMFLTAAIVLIPLARGCLRSWAFPRVLNRERALVIGTGREARLLLRKLHAHPEYGLDVVGLVGGEGEGGADAEDVVGSREDIVRLVDELAIDRVLLASSIASHEEMLDLVRTVRRPNVKISIVPNYFEVFTSHSLLDDVEGMPVVTLPPIRLGPSSRILKRSFDLVVASLLLLLLAPILALIALAIRIDSSGPALYRQPRRGRLGSTFQILKFRTMYVGSETKRADVLHLNDVDGPLFKIKGRDPRVTRVGGFLRKTSLDEIPQLWNVVRGEMSLVGPRPFVVYEADQITGWASKRLDMTPGITGLWQVLGRNDIPFDEMVKLDYLYVTNWSLWWDVKILCQTVPVVLGRRGAY